jgi:hypothetical protein
MDLDPSVEPELDSLSLTLPLPYRVALIVVLGMWKSYKGSGVYTETLVAVWAWGANLHYLALLRIVSISTQHTMNKSDESTGCTGINSIPSTNITHPSFTSPIHLPPRDHSYHPIIRVTPCLLDFHPPYPFARPGLRLAAYIISPLNHRPVLSTFTKFVPERSISLSHDPEARINWRLSPVERR